MIPDLAMRAAIWLSLFGWALAEVLRRDGDRRTAARASYIIGAALLIAHSAAAFHWRHGWSHAAALADTAARSAAVTGVSAGAGLYLNYLLIALWTADAVWWCAMPRSRENRARAIDIGLFTFFVFMFINGAVVFAHGPMRLAGAAAIAAAIAARLMPAVAKPIRGAA